MYKKTLTLMTCIKIRRATDIISHSLPERRSIFNAIGQSSPMFISVHSPAVEMDQAIWFRLCSGPPKGGVRDLWNYFLPFQSLFPSKHIRAWSVSM